METPLMQPRHRNAPPWLWQLSACEAATLQPQNAPRWLRVESGLVWVTAREAGPHGADLWLNAGESLELPAGTAWVLQAWPQARLSLAVRAPQCERLSRGAGAWARWLRRVRSRLLAAGTAGSGGWTALSR